MAFTRLPPTWRMPPGVDPPLWEYTHTPRLAAEEEAYFADHPMFEVDSRELDARFIEPGRLVDLGCGTGRHAIRFAARGFSVTAIDLARPMLEMVRLRAAERGQEILCVEANLCRLGCFPDRSFDYALSMFSTVGMIRGPESRRRALVEAARILERGGRFAFHAHNFWLNLRDSQGRKWLASQVSQAFRDRSLVGDRRMTYRGIHGMRVHLYRWGELRRALVNAGFRIDDVVPLDEVSANPIRYPFMAHGFRAGGWIVFCRRG